MSVSSKVGKFFNSYAYDFDNLYSKSSGKLSFAVFNALLRGALYKRYDFVESALSAGGDKGRMLLDVGFGTGRYMIKGLALGWDVSGLDIAPEMVSFAKARVKESGGDPDRVWEGDVLEFEFPQIYDMVIAMGFFDYIEHPTPVLHKLWESTNSRLIFSAPKKFHWLTPQRKFRYALRDCPLYFYTHNSLIECAKLLGCSSYEVVDLGRDYVCDFRR